MKKISTNAKRSSFLKLIKESDRGCVSVVCEFFNKLVGGMMVIAMHGKFIQKKRIPTSFADRIKDALAAKLISSQQYDALDAIRELRNEVDHTDIEFSLENKGVVAHLKQLEKYAEKITTDSLMEFEDILPIVEEENMSRLIFLATTFQIYEQLQEKMFELVDKL